MEAGNEQKEKRKNKEKFVRYSAVTEMIPNFQRRAVVVDIGSWTIVCDNLNG